MQAERLPNNPIITPYMDRRMGANVNGPSLIRAPDWLPNPLGCYYLYFAHHQGTYIRMAYADRLTGPWRIYEPGVLALADTPFTGHVASPDVHVDPERRELRMYCHGPAPEGGQRTAVALSEDGLHFTARPQILGPAYLRAFRWRDRWYAIVGHGVVCRSPDGLTPFERGPQLFTEKDLRHPAVLLEGDTLTVFYSNAGDRPEHIVAARIALTPDWTTWAHEAPESVLLPARDYEGADLPLHPSKRGWAPERVRELRDPAIYSEGERRYLLYSVAGEHGIAIAELTNVDR